MNGRAIKPFIILSSQRCGSTFIRIWLNQHSKIHCYGEVFLGYYQPIDGFRYYCNKSYSNLFRFALQHGAFNKYLKLNFLSDESINLYLDRLFNSAEFPAPWTDIKNRVNKSGPRGYKPIVGFKLMYNNLEQYPALDAWIEHSQPYILHITRRNLLRSYVSMVRMDVTKVDHSDNPEYRVSKIHIDPGRFIKYALAQIDTIDLYRSKYNFNGRYLEISYEDFFQSHVITKTKILNFFDQEDENMPFHGMKKLGSKKLKDDIENWNEVVEAVQDTRLSKYLSDEL